MKLKVGDVVEFIGANYTQWEGCKVIITELRNEGADVSTRVIRGNQQFEVGYEGSWYTKYKDDPGWEYNLLSERKSHWPAWF